MQEKAIESKRMLWLIKLLDCPYAKRHTKWHRFVRDFPYKDKHSEEIPGTLFDFERYLSGSKFSTGYVRRFLEELKEMCVLVPANEREYFVDKDALENLIKETETFRQIKSRWFND